MDLGIEGRRAIVCASSRGLGRACATALAREGVAVVVNGRDVERGSRRRPRRSATRPAPGSRRSSPTSAPRRAAGAWSPPVRSPTSWSPTTAAPCRVASRTGITRAWLAALEQNLLAPVAHDPRRDRRHARAPLRPHRQHHLGDGEVAASADGSLDRGAQRAHRRLQGPVARGGARQRHHQQPASRAHRHRSPALHGRPAGGGARRLDRGGVPRDRRVDRGESSRHARGVRRGLRRTCAARRPDSSRARTCRSTAARTRDSSKYVSPRYSRSPAGRRRTTRTTKGLHTRSGCGVPGYRWRGLRIGS